MTCKSQVWQEEGAGGRRGLATDLWLIRMGGNGDLDCGKLQEVGRRVEGQRRPGDSLPPTAPQRSQ